MKLRFTIMCAAVALVLVGCGQPVQVPAEEAELFANSVDDIVENSLVGLSNNDFAMHTRDFDDAMLEVVDPASFPQAYSDIIGVVGAYVSKQMSGVFDQAEFRFIVYSAKFSKEDNVSVRLVFRRDDPAHKISGMWFDSEKLRAVGSTK